MACSTAKAIEWDISFQNALNQDQSGRMVDVHDDATVVGPSGPSTEEIFQASEEDGTPAESDGVSASVG